MSAPGRRRTLAPRLALTLGLTAGMAACASDGNGPEGNWVEVWPSTAVDLGRIPSGETRDADLSFRNVGALRWHLLWQSGFANVQMGCAAEEPCVIAEPGDELTWRLTATAAGGDGTKRTQSRVQFVHEDAAVDDPEPLLAEYTVDLTWVVCGHDEPCDEP